MKKLITFEDIDKARKILEIPESASLEEIKEKHRKLILKYHPDKYNNSVKRPIYEEKVKQINNSYKIIMNYCSKYPISFDRANVKNVEEGEYMEDHFNRFYDGWVSNKD
jgi:curved DNA-binding protein CbpA